MGHHDSQLDGQGKPDEKKAATPAASTTETINEFSIGHRTTNDFYSGGGTFKPDVVDARDSNGRSLFAATLKELDRNIATHRETRMFSVTGGLVETWKDNKPYTEATRARLFASLNTNHTIPLNHHAAIQITSSSTYNTKDYAGPARSFTNPEIEFKNTHQKWSAGVGAVAGEGLADKQLYLTGKYKDFRVNIGTYDYDISQQSFPVRGMLSYTVPFDPRFHSNHKLSSFVSLESNKTDGSRGAQRFGIIHSSKLGSVSVQSNCILNTNAAHGIENIKAGGEVPFTLSKHGDLLLKCAINGLIGVAGAMRSDANPHPDTHLTYSAGLRLFFTTDKGNHSR